MKKFNWNLDKNQSLKDERNISFEQIIEAFDEGNIIEIFEHPNQQLYQGQKIYAVEIKNYIYLVPFVETETEIFLKTIIPSRKATKKYLEGKS